MKKLSVILIMLFAVQFCTAQTWDEYFNQKKTQKKYLLEQIAALQVYAGFLEKGYTIARDGLHIVQSIKKGDFNLHSHFFASLGIVNPAIKHYIKVGSIIAMQLSIAKQTAITIKQCRDSKQFTATEMGYLQQVFNHLLDDCAITLDGLGTIINNGNAQMTDDERIKRIDLLYNDMQDKQSFVQSFSNDAKNLAMQKLSDAKELTTLKKLNGVQ